MPPRPSEDWARGLRYGWFDELAAREEAVIATAHTMSDQAETVLFRMARGTGLHGLTGIPPRRGCYVRPCLCLTRADTEAYCAALGQHYIRDETNDQDVYARNRIRHDAIPALQYANPAAERSIARLCRQMRALDDWLTGEAAALLQAATVPGGYDVTVLRRAEGPVLDAALHALVSPVRDAEEKYISLLHFLVLKGEGAVQLTTLQLAPVLDQQAAGKVCLAFEFQRTSVLALLIVIYKDSRHRRSCRLGNRYFIADDQLAALYVQR